MKKRIALLSALATTALLAINPTGPPTGNVILEWTVAPGFLNPSNGFIVVGSPTLATPVTSWPALTNVSGMTTNVQVRITPGEFYFAVFETNIWGISPPSNVAATPPLPRVPLTSIRQVN